ncbi:MAG: nitronate monooxygenase, partial [Pseudomonadota bacterium]
RKQELCALLGTQHALIQAPMAGGPCTPELVAAVGRAGALGSFGFAYSQPEQIEQDIQRTRALADVPINANLFVFPNDVARESSAEALAAQASYAHYDSFDAAPPTAAPPGDGHPDVEAQIDVLCDLKPRVVTFHFGLPDQAVVDRIKATGASVGCSATTADDAETLVTGGADFVIAQGAEAGGPRGTFDPDRADHPIGTFALIPAIADRVAVPVVAAGGLMDGRAIAAAELLGADGAQLGTAFLSTDESGAAALYRDVMANHLDRPTVLTRGFSGRWARGVRNDFTEFMRDQAVLPFPLQNSLTAPLRAASKRAGSIEAQSVWAGQGFQQMRAIGVAELVGTLMNERDAALRNR